MANFTIEQQQEILKQYAKLLVTHWPKDKSQLTEKDLYEARKHLNEFLKVMPISPKAQIGACVNIARLVHLKYGIKGQALEDFIWNFNYDEFNKYKLLDALKETA